MKFGSVPLAEALGSILAHSIRGDGYSLKKGTVLTTLDLEQLERCGVTDLIAAQYETSDIAENEAARRIAVTACGANLRPDTAFTGRCNLRAEAAGVLRVSTQAVNAANGIDEALTLATPPDYARLAAGQLAATAKVIPYAAPRERLNQVCELLPKALVLHPFQPMQTTLVVTQAEGQKPSLAVKGAQAIKARMMAIGSSDVTVTTVPHTRDAVCNALAAQGSHELTLILGGSATSDRRDIAPAAVIAAGGTIDRFGMPVDPGNLLVLGTFRGNPMVILPGCARSMALNGADWVLERLAARLPVTSQDIAEMGVGGLLKEIPSRPQPREKQ